MSTSFVQYVPNQEEIFSALSEYRAANPAPLKRPSAKVLLKAIQADHPDYKLTHQRLVKILKKEGTVEKESSENNQTAANNNATPTPNLFSPNSRARIAKADSPVSSKNVITGSRLRPKNALSFVYGKARKMKTPTTKAPETYCPYETSEGETNDPSFIPLNEAEEGDMEAEPWVRREKKEQKMRTPEVVVIAEREKTPAASTPTPPSPPVVARTIVSELMKEESKPLAASSDPVVDEEPAISAVPAQTDEFIKSAREGSITTKEDTSCFSALDLSKNKKGSCSVM